MQIIPYFYVQVLGLFSQVFRYRLPFCFLFHIHFSLTKACLLVLKICSSPRYAALHFFWNSLEDFLLPVLIGKLLPLVRLSTCFSIFHHFVLFARFDVCYQIFVFCRLKLFNLFHRKYHQSIIGIFKFLTFLLTFKTRISLVYHFIHLI